MCVKGRTYARCTPRQDVASALSSDAMISFMGVIDDLKCIDKVKVDAVKSGCSSPSQSVSASVIILRVPAAEKKPRRTNITPLAPKLREWP
jgi:hypothetical protein